MSTKQFDPLTTTEWDKPVQLQLGHQHVEYIIKKIVTGWNVPCDTGSALIYFYLCYVMTCLTCYDMLYILYKFIHG